MMIDRRLITRFDWPLVGMVILIACIGILNLYSITSNGEASGTPYYLKQVFWLLMGLAIMIVIAFVEYRFYSDLAYVFYAAVLFTLVLVFAFGMVTSGAQRWIKIGSFSFQPSEFAKIAVILILAKLFQRPPKREGFSLRELLLPFVLLLLPVALILKQPDLGTSIILVLIFVSVLLFVKVRWSSWLIMIVAVLSVLPLLWSVLKDYQKKRILTFFNPDLDPLGAGYHVIQSKIAVGSGGLFGKGFMNGTQCKLGFLPEQHTDFIFSVLAEEWGLLGFFLCHRTLFCFGGLGTANCRSVKGSLWCHSCLRCGGNALLARVYQYRNGFGNDACRRDPPPSSQLRWILPRFHAHGDRSSSECEYAQVSVLIKQRGLSAED